MAGMTIAVNSSGSDSFRKTTDYKFSWKEMQVDNV